MNAQLSIPKSELADFCQAHGIRRLAIFGSALRADFDPESEEGPQSFKPAYCLFETIKSVHDLREACVEPREAICVDLQALGNSCAC